MKRVRSDGDEVACLLALPRDVLGYALLRHYSTAEAVFALACVCRRLRAEARVLVADVLFSRDQWLFASWDLALGHTRLLRAYDAPITRLYLPRWHTLDMATLQCLSALHTLSLEHDPRDEMQRMRSLGLGTLTQLASLSLGGNARELVERMGHMTRLRALDLSGMGLSARPVRTLPTSLTRLDLTDAQLPLAAHALNASLAHLTALEAQGCFTLELRHVDCLPALRRLSLSSACTSLVTSAVLCGMTQLRSLTLRDWDARDEGEAGCEAVRRGMTQLETLEFLETDRRQW